MLTFFTQGNALPLLQKQMTRVINTSFSTLPFAASNGAELRSEMRSRRNMNCMVFKIDDSKEIVDCWPCFTVDLSTRGSSVYVTKEFSVNEKYIFVLRHDKEFVMTQAQCMRCTSNHLGGYHAGFQFMELVDLKGFLSIKLLLEMLGSAE
jgi:hypothetical protein